jgi:thioredoxin reductase
VSAPFSFRFEGREIAALPGHTIAAALAMAGVHELRDTPEAGSRRGIFCGMGVCQECLVTVDGTPSVRACLAPAAPGLRVSRQRYPVVLPEAREGAPAIAFADLAEERTDVAIIGAGAGGLAAATAVRAAGLDAIVLDERPAPGGQFYKQAASALEAGPLDDQQRAGGELVRSAVDAGARIWSSTEVVDALGPDALLVIRGGRSLVVRARALVIATGAYERGLPVPGWTLPGVMTTGAMQTLWRSYRVAPGRRVIIAGNGPLNLQVATELHAAGAEVAAVAEAAPILAPARAGALARLWLADPRLAAKGAGLIRDVRASGARLLTGALVLKIERAGGGGLAVTVGTPYGGSRHTFAVDTVALGYGFQPSNELLRRLGCPLAYDPGAGMLRAVRSDTLEIGVPGVFAVGDCAGLGGAPAAGEEGAIAGAAIAARLLGQAPADVLDRAIAAGRRLARHRRFQRALWDLFEAPRPGLALADEETLVCRCENVSKREILRAQGRDHPASAEIKRRTRAGMGRCQGRYCGPLLAEHLAAAAGGRIDERSFFAPRGPVKPVRISDLVRGHSP